MEYAQGKRFKKALLGYKRSAVDDEMLNLLSQVDMMMRNQENMRSQIDTLSGEKSAAISERDRLSGSVTSMSAQIVQLEQNLQIAQSTSDNLRMTIEAGNAERNTLQNTCEQLRVRDREYAMREREFSELQNSVSSIMSVTKRATDRLFQRAVDNQEQVTGIAGDAAKEVASIRASMSAVRIELNNAMDDLQDRLDRIDATLTGAVHKLVAVKHDNGLHPGAGATDINAEVERLLSMRAGEVDYAGGKGYSVPVLGPYSAKFLADTSKAVKESGTIDVRKVNQSPFDSTKSSIGEANRLLNEPVTFGYTEEESEPVEEVSREEKRAAMGVSEQKIGFSAQDEYGQFETTEAEPVSIGYTEEAARPTEIFEPTENCAPMYVGDSITSTPGVGTMQVGRASFVEYEDEPEQKAAPKRVTVESRAKAPTRVKVYYRRSAAKIR